MTTPRLAIAIGYIDDELIEAAAAAKSPRRSAWLKWGSIAACFAILLATGIGISSLRRLEGDPPPQESEGISTDPIIPFRYYDYGIGSGTFSDYIGNKVIAGDKIGKKIEDVVVIAGWKNEAGEWISTENLNAEIYEIEGVDTEDSVALKFIDGSDAVDTTQYYMISHPNAEYNGMVFPDYKAENPVRYLEESDMGKCNGWQDFGISGEIRTITMPIGSTYVYQMYSYYIRNDLQHLYREGKLPESLSALPDWLADMAAKGRKSFWYSMGQRLPEQVTLTATSEIISDGGDTRFIKAEYVILLKDHEGMDKEENWVVYLMEEDGVYSAYAVAAHENFEFVKSYSESTVKSYQKKQ